jgi:hypothetical protein
MEVVRRRGDRRQGFGLPGAVKGLGGKGYAKKLMAQMSRIFRLGKVAWTTIVAKLGQINPSCLIFRTYFPPHHPCKIATIFAPLDALEFESSAMSPSQRRQKTRAMK